MLDLLGLIPALGVTAVMAVYAFEPLRADCLHRWAAWWSRFPRKRRSIAMLIHDLMGFAAVGSALIAVGQKPALRMRAAALASNLLFIAYGSMGPAYPTLVLHSILLPLNIRHIVREVKARRAA